MENARLLIAGLEMSTLSETERNASLASFCNLVSSFHQSKVSMNMQEGLTAHTFSFGTVYNDLFYTSWQQFSQNTSFKGIEQTTHELFINISMEHPSFGSEITDDDWLSKDSPRTSYGIVREIQDLTENYVIAKEEWQELRAHYYATHPGIYQWKKEDDDFLPNRQYSDTLLEKEILRSDCSEAYIKAKAKGQEHVLSTFFHNEIMQKQGSNLAAYTRTIGKKICEANFYQYERELSATESKLHKNSLRMIFSTVNRHHHKQYISLDFLHGMMEFHDHKGTHLGEYRFTGIKNADAETSHDLTSLY